MADSEHSTRTRLSRLFRDPYLRAAFERADRDRGEPMLVPAKNPRPVLQGGAAEKREAAHV